MLLIDKYRGTSIENNGLGSYMCVVCVCVRATCIVSKRNGWQLEYNRFEYLIIIDFFRAITIYS